MKTVSFTWLWAALIPPLTTGASVSDPARIRIQPGGWLGDVKAVPSARS